MRMNNVLISKEGVKVCLPAYQNTIVENDLDYWAEALMIRSDKFILRIYHKGLVFNLIFVLLFLFITLCSSITVSKRIKQIGIDISGVIILGCLFIALAISTILIIAMLRLAMERGVMVVTEHRARMVLKSMYNKKHKWVSLDILGAMLVESPRRSLCEISLINRNVSFVILVFISKTSRKQINVGIRFPSTEWKVMKTFPVPGSSDQ